MTQNIIKSDIYQLAEIDGEMKIRDLELAFLQKEIQSLQTA